jgi:hypothetical protein
MDTFAEVRNHIMQHFELTIDEPFILSFDYPIEDSGRLQSIFLAELKTGDGRRVLRVETPVAPLADFDAEKCLRINLMQRVGYLAVGDLESTPYIKMCENLPYAFLGEQELDYAIRNVARSADQMEQSLENGKDLS